MNPIRPSEVQLHVPVKIPLSDKAVEVINLLIATYAKAYVKLEIPIYEATIKDEFEKNQIPRNELNYDSIRDKYEAFGWKVERKFRGESHSYLYIFSAL